MEGNQVTPYFQHNGSGSSHRAAKDFGIEIEEQYCRYAANRMAQEILFPLPRDLNQRSIAVVDPTFESFLLKELNHEREQTGA